VADLQELANTSMAVVRAGAKSILDIGLTLEYLETHSVPVLSCEQDNFAAFCTRDSGFRADFRLDDAAEQARFIRTRKIHSDGILDKRSPVAVSAAPDLYRITQFGVAHFELGALIGNRNVDARAVRLPHASNEQGSRHEKCHAAQRRSLQF